MLIAAIILITAFLVAIPYYSSHKTASDNAMALKQLNQKIYKYGGSMRYLLSNATVYYTALNITPSVKTIGSANASEYFNYLKDWTSNQTDIPSALYPSWLRNSSFNSSAMRIDWGINQPAISALTVDALFSLGVLPMFNLSDALSTRPLLMAGTKTALENMYTLQSSGTYILSTSIILGSLFSATGGALRNPTPSQVIGDAMINQDQRLLGTFTITTLLNSTLNDSLDMGISNGWLGLIYSIGTNPLNTTNTTTTAKSSMYMFSLDQYEGYFFSQILYNNTIAPNIDFVGYSHHMLLVNMGNINLTATQPIALYVDGNKENYTQYYNFLASDLNLGVGLHSVKVNIGSKSMSQELYISPMLASASLNRTSGALYFGFMSVLHNISVSNVSFLSQPPSFDHANLSYYKLLNLTVPSSTPNSVILLAENQTADHTGFSFRAQAQRCSYIGEPRTYFLSADTNYGKAYYVIYIKCA